MKNSSPERPRKPVTPPVDAAKLSFLDRGGRHPDGHVLCVQRRHRHSYPFVAAANLAEIPDSFKLVLEMETAARRCAVVWRKEKQIGVEFR